MHLQFHKKLYFFPWLAWLANCPDPFGVVQDPKITKWIVSAPKEL